MKMDLQYILIDDSEFDLYLNREFLMLAGIKGSILSFDSAPDALSFIIKEGDEMKPSIILLDIHMPVMGGFEFLDKFSLLPDHVKKIIRIFMVSSTLDVKDIERAKSSSLVEDMLNKPLNVESLLKRLG